MSTLALDPAEATDFVTVLAVPPDRRLTKFWPEGDSKSDDYDTGRIYHSQAYPVDGIASQYAMLCKLALKPRACVIRGKLKPGTDRKYVKRRMHPRDGEPGYFDAAAHYWSAWDLDGAPAPEGTDFVVAPAQCLAVLRDTKLPARFRRVTMAAQLTASAGKKPGIRVRLWFWASRPLTDAECKTLAAEWSGLAIDKTLFSAVQPHYTGNAIFENTNDDPFNGRDRVLLVPGERDVVDVPEYLTAPVITEGAHKRAAKSLKHFAKRFAEAKEGDRHETLTRGAFTLAMHYGTVLSREAVYKEFAKACDENLFPAARFEDEFSRPWDDGLAKAACMPAWRADLTLGEHGPAATMANMMTVLAKHPDIQLAYDCRSLTVCLMAPPPWDSESACPRAWRDTDATHAVVWMGNEAGFEPSTARMHEGVCAVARDRPFDPFRDEYLKGLTWDGTPRTGSWLADYAGAQDIPYTRVVGQKFLISIVARAYHPGCDVQTTLVLSGPQNIGKSSLLRELVGSPFFSDNLSPLDSKDAKQELCGPVLFELGELDVLRRHEVETIKRFVSAREDRFRPPYGRVVETHPRRCVFAGTTNKDEYLIDETGNRRFWPVQTTRCDWARMSEDRDQLWAEAVHLYHAGEAWHLTAVEGLAAAEAQESARVVDSWEELLATALDQKPTKHKTSWGVSGAGVVHDVTLELDQVRDDQVQYITRAQAFELVTGLSAAREEPKDQRRLGKVLKALGWEHAHLPPSQGRKRIYRRPEAKRARLHSVPA